MTVTKAKPKLPENGAIGESRWMLLLGLVSLVILFSGLGSAALFEPDEGRNAEKAREVLLLQDFVTPHQNFLPTLDKPMFFYWLIAVAFKVFGASEGAARLPSAVAAIGCLFLVYRFARRQWGLWEALWICLVLVTSLQFFIFSRLVMLDMTLTFFITWALLSFYDIAESAATQVKKRQIISLYAAMAVGTVLKGPVALIVPGLVIFCFLLFTRNRAVLRRMHLLRGALIYFVIVTPWYLSAELRNPGFLRYFFWDEHFLRYLTPRFGRSRNWYFFFMVIGIGFVPWSLLLPLTVKRLWQQRRDPFQLFLGLWIILPFAFFSASSSKLPQYVLPIYPALAMIGGQVISNQLRDRGNRLGIAALTPWVFALGMTLYLCAGIALPELLASQIRMGVLANTRLIAVTAVVLLLLFAVLVTGQIKNASQHRGFVYLCNSVGLALFIVLTAQVVASSSFNRISKPLVQLATPFIEVQDQLVFYDNYLEGLPFYLRIEKPIWLVQAGNRRTIMASNYLAAHRPAPAPGYGPVLLSYEEFAERWKTGKQTLRVFVRARHLDRLIRDIGAIPKKQRVELGEYLLVSNRNESYIRAH